MNIQYRHCSILDIQFQSCALIDALCHLVFEHPFLHPAHGQQIVKGCEQAVPDAVIAFAGESWVVGNGDFRHGKTFHFNEGRQKSVHAFEEL